MEEFDGFKSTPQPRELTENEYIELLHSGCDKTEYHYEPTIEMTSEVWAAANNGKLPIYRFYYQGTNALTTLRYTWDNDKWEKIKLEEVDNLYGIIWKILLFGCWKYKNFSLREFDGFGDK